MSNWQPIATAPLDRDILQFCTFSRLAYFGKLITSDDVEYRYRYVGGCKFVPDMWSEEPKLDNKQ